MLRINYPHLFDRARTMAPIFAAMKPFPYWVFDGLFDAAAYRLISAAFPEPDSQIWKQPDNAHTQGKRVTKRGPEGVKELLYDQYQRQIVHELNSGAFVHFLRTLSGIPGLVPDPDLAESGFHLSGNGGFLDIHADFSHHDTTGLERRLNLIYFVNDDWKPEWGGELKLYDRDLSPAVAIAPTGNRAVVFETGPDSYHGHPERLNAPAGIFRRSIAMYYYTVPRPNRERRGALFPTDPDFKHQASRI
jgi:hypothetical protein